MSGQIRKLVRVADLSADQLRQLCGAHNGGLKHIQRAAGADKVTVVNDTVLIEGNYGAVTLASQQLKTALHDLRSVGKSRHTSLRAVAECKAVHTRRAPVDPSLYADVAAPVCWRDREVLRPQTRAQAEYLDKARTHKISFGLGPAGTGKTLLSVGLALEALDQKLVKRIVFVRPAREAGEYLGFLPGTASEKVEPYQRPLLDAMHLLIGPHETRHIMESRAVQIEAVAYMRGRSLDNTFLMVDEAQNTTISQMKMLLTRIGFDAQAVFVGDPEQYDLPSHERSGLAHAVGILAGVEGIGIAHFGDADIVRHSLVRHILAAYAKDQNG